MAEDGISIGIPKPRPKLLDKRDERSATNEKDRKEREKCHVRSGGRCEVIEIHRDVPVFMGIAHARCLRRASENHHLLGGIGRRNRGRSILAEHRLDVCARCHEEITGHVLVPCVPQAQAERAATVRYERRG